MIRTLVRVVIGFALACLAAGVTTVLFVTTPADLAASTPEELPDKLSQTFTWALLAATHSAIFAAAFALIATSLAEWRGWRWLLYYLLTGAVIALLGFYAQYASEVAGQPSILNSYAVTAFVSAGLMAGFVYWLVSGRNAGGTQREGWDPVPATNPSRPRIIVETRPETERPKRPASLAERVAKAEAASKPAAADDETPNSA